MAIAIQPIWKDTILTFNAEPSGTATFRISVYEGGSYVVIFQGVVYPRPDGSLKARINDIVADYLTRALPLEDNDWYECDFKVEYYDEVGGSWEEYGDGYRFTRDWSYDRSFVTGTDTPLAPLTDHLNPHQYLPIFSTDGHFRATIITGDFNSDFNLDFSSQSWYADYERNGFTYFLDLTDYPDWTRITANGRTYYPGDFCGGYVLYYINAYGGWDTLPVQGRTILTDAFTRYEKGKVYDNNTAYARGRENYVTERVERYALSIGPLNQMQSELMHHLTGSTYVYLHDIVRGEVLPVVLTNGEDERKNRPGGVYTYELTAELAQDRLRR